MLLLPLLLLLLQVLSLLLEAAGFSLVHVMSGAATLAFLAACELLPDLVLLDVSGGWWMMHSAAAAAVVGWLAGVC
jgi:L-ascorbate metabolism protein UlaG (beta-lactamase superfamily)